MNHDKISRLLSELSEALNKKYGSKATVIDVNVQCLDASTLEGQRYFYTVTIEATQTDKFYHD